MSRAAELLYTGRALPGSEAERFGFYNVVARARGCIGGGDRARENSADGPTFGHAMTKRMLWQEWSAALGECIEAEAQAQAICMQTKDFKRAYYAFANKKSPVFEGN